MKNIFDYFKGLKSCVIASEAKQSRSRKRDCFVAWLAAHIARSLLAMTGRMCLVPVRVRAIPRGPVQKILLVFVLGMLVLTGGVYPAEAATEFVCTIKSSGGDYTGLTTWDAAGVCDLTASTTKVFGGTTTLTVSDGDAVTGANSSATGTVVHATATQVLIKSISGTFQSGEQVQVDGATSNYVTISDAGDSAIAVAEMYIQENLGTSTFTLSGWTTSATNYVEIRANSGQKHTGVVGVGGAGVTFSGTSGTSDSVISSGVGNLKLKDLYIESTNTSTGDLLDIATGSSVTTITGCLIHKSSSSTAGNMIAVAAGVLKMDNNFLITHNTSDAAIDLVSTASGTCYLYANTLYSAGGGTMMANASADSDTNCKSNIVFGFANPPFSNTGGSALTDDYNAYDGAYTIDPVLKNKTGLTDSDHLTALAAGSENLHLKTTSVLRGEGWYGIRGDANLAVTTDVDGTTRTSWDIGADELGEPFDVTSPDTDVSWEAGTTTNDITWTKRGDAIVNVKISYSTDSGSNYDDVVVDSTTNDGTYSWTVPDILSSTVKIKVENVLQSAASDDSAVDFNVVIPTLEIIAPDGGESRTVGQAYNITWSNVGTISDDLTLYYKKDAGAGTYNDTIATGEDNDGTYSWTTPSVTAAESDLIRVKVEDVFYQKLIDKSADNFSVEAGATHTDTWVSGTGNAAVVKLAGDATETSGSATGLVGLWHFNEGTGGTTADDDDVNNNTGTIAGATWTTSGKLGNALDFDGANSYVDLGSDPSLNITGNMTVSAWFYYTGTPSSYMQIVVGKDSNGGGRSFNLGIMGPFWGGVNGVLMVSTQGSKRVWGSAAVSTETWHHGAWTWDGSNNRVYLDGAEIGTPAGIGPASATTSTTIGRRNYGGVEDSFPGRIDEVAIYDIALEEADILALYNSQKGYVAGPGTFESRIFDTGGSYEFGTIDWTGVWGEISSSADGLIGLWHFNEGQGSETTADSGDANNNTGTLGSTAIADGNDPDWTASGRFGNALDFNGISDYVDCGSDASLKTASFSVAAWINPSSDSNMEIVIHRRTDSTIAGYAIYVLSNKVRFFATTNGGTWGVDIVSDNVIVVDGSAWTHIVATFTSGSGKLYINGDPQTATSSATGSISYDEFPLRIGYSSGGNNFGGLIDEVAVYNKALDQAEVTALYGDGVDLGFTIKARTSATVDGNGDLVSPTDWASCSAIADGADITSATGVTDAHQYIQYQATLSTSDTSVSPSLSDIAIQFSDSTEADRVISDESDEDFSIGAGAITVAAVTPASLVAGVTGNVTITFTSINAVPSGGKVVVTFPTAADDYKFDVSSAAFSSGKTISNVGVSGQVLTLTLGADITPTEDVTIILSSIENPDKTGVTGAFELETQTTGAKRIDRVASVSEITIVSDVTTYYTITTPADITAGGTRATYTTTRYDQYDNLSTEGAEPVYLYRTASGASAKFYDALTDGTEYINASNALTFADIASSATFYYDDTQMGEYTITVSDNSDSVPDATGKVDATHDINVKHAAADHLVFSADIASPQDVNVSFNLGTLNAVDQYGNILTNDYTATPYEGSKTITYTLSGTDDPPNPSEGITDVDTYTETVNFTNGSSTTTLATTLYCAQDTTITASAGDLTTPVVADVASNEITVNFETADKVVFTQQPSATGIINAALAQQPIVQIQDQYGNRTDDTDNVTLYGSTSNSSLVGGDGDITGSNPIAADDGDISAGEAHFAGITYTLPGVIYFQAQVAGVSVDYSDAVTFAADATSTIDVAASPAPDFNLTPTNDTLAVSGDSTGKFEVLKFKITDAGGDSSSTMVDEIKIKVDGGTAANASTDIAWAELRSSDGGDHQVATAASIGDDFITFGASDNADSIADLDEITDSTSIEYTINIYMKNTKLTATEDDTYVFDVDESLISADSGVDVVLGASSQLTADSTATTPVTGTIAVTVSYLGVVDDGGNATISLTAGIGENILIRGTDSNKNIDEDYIGNQTFKFSGLNTIGSDVPIVGITPGVGEKVFGNNTTIPFTAGISATRLLTAYAMETGSVSIADQNDLALLAHTLEATVDHATESSMAEVSGNNQSGAVSVALPNPFITVIKDQYGNPVDAVTLTWAILVEQGSGASLSEGLTVDTDVNGQVANTFTLGSVGGAHTVTATVAALAGSGSPVTFTATSLTPASLTKTSGDTQTKAVTLTLDTACTIKLADSGGTGVPDQTVTFSIVEASCPAGAYPSGTSGKLSATSVTTASNGGASTILTLGEKTGAYVMRASWTDGVDTFTADFTATAISGGANKVALSGPASVVADTVTPTPLTISILDQYDNVVTSSVGHSVTDFNITVSAGGNNNFYPAAVDTLGTEITSKQVAANASTADFYFKDTVTGVRTITVTKTGGELLPGGVFANWNITVTPEGLDHFKVTAEDMSTVTAGGSRTITITAQDANNNTITETTGPRAIGDMDIVFSGASASPAPSSITPTCDAVNFGSPTTLDFTTEPGIATAEFIPYAAGAVSIKAKLDESIVTSNANDLDIVVAHAAADHLKFAADLPSPQVAGTAFNFETTLDAVDIYDNICDGANGATAYTEASKTVTWVLSGTSNGPDNGTDVFTDGNPIAFSSGSSTTTLSATLFRAQDTTITASVVGLSGTNAASGTITVGDAGLNKLTFNQQPAGTPPVLTNAALETQPVVALSDTYGNAVVSASDQITFSVIPVDGTANGTLSATANPVTSSSGVATFAGIKYSYPEQIKLRATASSGGVDPKDSNVIDFKTSTTDGAIAAGDLPEPATISSLIDTSAEKMEIFDFKLTDTDSDGYGIKVKKIVITRDTVNDTTNGWSSYIKGSTISDGTTTTTAVITDNNLTFGDGGSVIYTVSANTSKTYTLSLYLKSTLPVGGDGKVVAFDIDPDDDITTDAIGSRITPAGSMTSSTTITVVATKFLVTGSVATVNAGVASTATLKATDANANIDLDYQGSKNIVFSGAADSSGGTVPTCNGVDFADVTSVNFIQGTNASIDMILYKSENAAVKATDSDASPAIITSADDDLNILVIGGTASQLTWNVSPQTMAVANAPWKMFSVNLSDAYGNVASGSDNVTIEIDSGGTLTALSTNAVAAESGTASFYDIRVISPADPESYPAYAKIRAIAGVKQTSWCDTVTMYGKYSIRLNVYDSVYTTSALTALDLEVLDPDGATVVSQSGNNSPLVFYLAYDTYTFNLTRDAYVDTGVQKVPDAAADGADGTYDREISWTLYMTSVTESMADYSVLSDFVYNEVLDELYITIRLERRGQQKVSSGAITLQTCTVQIFENSVVDPEVYLGTLNSADSNGNYWFTISDAVGSAGFGQGKSYFAKSTINYGPEGSAVPYVGTRTFQMGVAVQLAGITSAIAAEVASVQENVITGLTTVTAEQARITQAAIVAQAAAIITETDLIKTATSTTIPTSIAAVRASVIEDVQPHVRAGILTRSGVIKQGTKVTIRYRTGSGLAPTISVYNPKNVQKIAAQLMTESTKDTASGTSVYTYPVTFSSGWGEGDFTVICSESTKGTIDSIIITATSEDLADVASTTSAILGATSGLGDLDSTATGMTAQVAALEAAIARLGGRMQVPTVSTGTGTGDGGISATKMEGIFSILQSLSAQVEAIAGGKTVGLEKLYEVAEEKKEDVKYIKNKTQELKALMELNQKMIDNVANEPIVQTWYEYGSVILKSIVINPSKTQAKIFAYKLYLPKEAKPEHVIKRGDLLISYDTQQGSYYVHAKLKLKPEEVMEIEIELEDIWVITTEQIDIIMKEANDVVYKLQDSEFSDRANFLLNGIKKQMDKIIERQKNTPANPEVHISMYRENIKMLEEAELDLILLRSLLNQVKPNPLQLTWKLIVAIVLFLGILSLGFYVVWQHQLKLTEVPSFDPDKDDEEATEKSEKAEGGKEDDKSDEG